MRTRKCEGEGINTFDILMDGRQEVVDSLDDLCYKIESYKTIYNRQAKIVCDILTDMSEEDKVLLEMIQDKKHIVLINKIDTGKKINRNVLKSENIIEISIKNDIGLDILEEKIEEIFHSNDMDTDDSVMITNTRHKNLILQARNGLKNALDSAKNGLPIDMLAIDISDAIKNLGEITGEAISEEVINGIFAKFCLGK